MQNSILPGDTDTRHVDFVWPRQEVTRSVPCDSLPCDPHRCRPGISDRSQVLSPGTLRLLMALQDRLVAFSPLTRLSLPRSERERIVPLSVAQVQALAQAMPARSKTMEIPQAGLACGSPSCWRSGSKMLTSCDEQCGSSGSFARREAAGFHP